jgi:hypothetical protein
MPLDLSGVHAKLDRGYEHLEALHAEVITWIHRYPYGLRHETNDEGREHIGILDIYREPDSARFGLLIGDCAHNFRSALDHLVFTVARDRLGPADLEAVEEKLSFPLTTTPDNWNNALARGCLEGVGSGVRAEIQRRQPHKAGDPSKTPLYALHWLNNRDKHRLLHAVAAFPQLATINFVPELPGPNEGSITPPPYAHGTEIFRARSAEPCPDMQVECDLVMEIRVREAPLSEDIRELLLKIGQLVQGIAFDVAKAHLADLAAHE